LTAPRVGHEAYQTSSLAGGGDAEAG